MKPLNNLPFKFMPVKFNFEKGRGGSSIQFIIFHDTGNRGRGADAMAHYKYFNSKYVGASAHYFVDDKQIIQIIGDNNTAWAVGDNQGHGRALNGAKNRNSISVELCINADTDYEVAYANAIELIKALQKKFNISNKYVQRHYDVSRKNCPGTMSENNWSKYNKLKAALSNPPILEIDLSKDSISKWVGSSNPPTPSKQVDVKSLQNSLAMLGYNLDIDGSYGPGTTKVVRQYQVDRGLQVDGSAGPEVLASIDKDMNDESIPKFLKLGVVTRSVTGIQGALREIGYAIQLTNIYDISTENAVRRFQGDYMKEYVKGVADVLTRDRIFEVLEIKRNEVAEIPSVNTQKVIEENRLLRGIIKQVNELTK